LWDTQGNAVIFDAAGLQLGKFHNAGTLRRSGDAGTASSGIFLENQGRVEVRTGALALTRGSDLGGRFQADAGAVISFPGGEINVNRMPAFEGPGDLVFNGARVNLQAPVPHWEMGGGTLSGLEQVIGLASLTNCTLAGTNRLVGTLNVSGRLFVPDDSSLTVEAGAELRVNAAQEIHLYGPLINRGTVIQAGWIIVYNNGGQPSNGDLRNESGALWDTQGNAFIYDLFGLQLSKFHNAGTLRRSGDPGTAISGIFLENQGRVEVRTGALTLGGGSLLAGTIEVEPAACLNFEGPQNLVKAGTVCHFADTRINNRLVVEPGAVVTFKGSLRNLGEFVNQGDTHWLPMRSYRLAQDAYDRSGFAVTGVVTNGAAFVSSAPPVQDSGGSLHFDGVDDALLIPDRFSRCDGGMPGYSISLWLRADRVGPAGIVTWTDDSGTQSSWSHQIRINNDGQLEHYVFSSAGAQVVTATSPVIPGNWYHVVASAADSGLARLYVDGVEQGAGMPVGTLWGGGTRWVVGNAFQGGPYQGSLAQLKIWGNAVPWADIQAENPPTDKVRPPNTAPGFAAIPSRRIDESTGSGFRLTATDADFPPQVLTFGKVNGPEGLQITSDGWVTWTPTEVQGPSTNQITFQVSDGISTVEGSFTLIVDEVNVPPALAALADQSVDEGNLLSLTLTATDVDLPAQTLTFSKVSGPVGLTVSASGQLSWTPTEAQGPSTNTVTVRVSDGVANADRSFTVVVNEVNEAPVLAAVPNQTINEGTLLNLTLTATDVDLPAQTLTFSKVSGPEGLTVSASGQLSWTPTEAQGPSTNTVTVRVSDGVANADRSFTVVVNEVNEAPVLAAVPNQTINEGTLLNLTLTATDVDLPAQTLTFSKVSGPVGLTVSASGQLSWTPTEAQGPSTNTVTVRVSDGVANADRSFTVVVNEFNASVRLQLFDKGQKVSLDITGGPGQQVDLETSSNLANWSLQQRVTTAGSGAPINVVVEMTPQDAARFWRVRRP